MNQDMEQKDHARLPSVVDLGSVGCLYKTRACPTSRDWLPSCSLVDTFSTQRSPLFHSQSITSNNRFSDSFHHNKLKMPPKAAAAAKASAPKKTKTEPAHGTYQGMFIAGRDGAS